MLRESFKEKLEHRNEFPDMPISYGFRGRREFWFARHEKPFHYPLPQGKELDPKHVSQVANSLNPEVHFTQEACAALVVIPESFLEPALDLFITKAKQQGTDTVDLNFVKTANTRWVSNEE